MRRSPKPTVVALCGSLRSESRTRIVLRELLGAAERAGAETRVVDLRAYELPPLYGGESEVSDAGHLREILETADSLALGTPNYHGSYAGSLKNALDYCGRDEIGGTTVGLVEVAAGDFPGSANTHLRQVCRTLHAWTLPTAVAIPDSHSVISDEGIEDEDLEGRTHRLGRELVAYAGMSEFPDVVGRKSTPENGSVTLD